MTAAPAVRVVDGDPVVSCERRRLASGLDVVVHPDPTTPLCAVNVWYRVGSSDERPEQSGHAHLFEHLFKNSQHLAGKKHYEILRRAGAVDSNASTGADRTAFHQILPAEQLDLALWIESDRMGYLLPGLDDARVAQQQAVVLAERRQRYENVPYGADRFAVARALYPEGHPHRHLTIGRPETIAAATRDDLATWYRTWFVPANATLVVAGNVDADDAWARVERWFGGFPASTRPPRPVPVPASIGASSRTTVDDPFASIRRLHLAWHGVAAFGGGDAELDVLASVLGAPGTGRLWRALVYERPWAQRVSAWHSATRLGGELHVVVDLRAEAEVDAVRDVVDEVVAAARAGDPATVDARAVARVCTRRDAAFLWRLDGLGRRTAALQRYLLYLDDPGGLAVDLARYRAVTLDGVIAAARRWLAPDARVEVETRALRAA
ncbi:MAG: insulinase family protein [Kofleriaceae bacterium]|nr:insulinase family protein [Kofleriaceae bacterium]